MEDDHSNLETSSDTDADLSPETEHMEHGHSDADITGFLIKLCQEADERYQQNAEHMRMNT